MADRFPLNRECLFSWLRSYKYQDTEANLNSDGFGCKQHTFYKEYLSRNFLHTQIFIRREISLQQNFLNKITDKLSRVRF